MGRRPAGIRSDRGRRGFTLLELLVVIGILSVLLSILVPALTRAQAKARATKCKAQLQQIGVALRMYLNENKDRYPPSPALPSVNPYGLTPLTTYLRPNLANVDEIFHCPSDADVFRDEKTSYFYYAELGERKVEQTFLCKVLGSPGKVPVLWDADNFHGGAVPYNWLFVDGRVDQFIEPGTK